MKIILKKYLFIFLSCIIMMGLTGCSDEVTDTSESTQHDSSYLGESTGTIEAEKESEIVDNRIKLTFSQDEVYYKHYKDVYSMFEKLGFTEIEYNVSEMSYSDEEQYDGAVIEVQIDKKSKFEKDALFETNIPIIISYVQDLRIQVPKSSADCEGVKYTEVVNMFEKAGFTNVKVYGTEIEYTTKVSDKTVLIISVDGKEAFDKNAKFKKDAEVKIFYYIILPAPVQSEQQDNSNINQNNGGSNKQEMVWIPKTGEKYHCRSSCSNMKNPRQVTKEEAEEMGYEPCKKCY